MLDQQVDTEEKLNLIKSGRNFLGILNDIKRRPEDAARELGVSPEEIQDIINGKKSQQVSLRVIVNFCLNF